MEYVKDICGQLGVECLVYHKDIAKLAEEMKCSTEEAGRYYRYAKFEETARKFGANKIAVAHNMNDSSETVLLNLFRGTGIKGLCGIPAKRDNIVRPLLCVSRAEIEAFLAEQNISYRTDSTNLTDEYTRNKIRRNILPYATGEINAHTVENIIKAAGQLNDIEDYLTIETEKAKNSVIIKKEYRNLAQDKFNNDTKNDKKNIKYDIDGLEDDNIVSIDLDYKEWINTHPTIQKRVIRDCINEVAGRLKDITETHIDLIMDLWTLEPGKQLSLPYNIYSVRTADGVKLIKGEPDKRMEHPNIGVHIIVKRCGITESPTRYNVPGGIFEISYQSLNEVYKGLSINADNTSSDNYNCTQIPDLMYTKWFDCGKIKSDLQIRTRMEGDFIEIDSSGNRKKLKTYFIDEKIPKDDRDNILLVADGSHILWIVGYRMSSGAKIGATTQNVLKIQYYENK